MGDCKCGEGEGWAAWHDWMPGKEPTLYVQGACMCPTPKYRLELRPQEPQGTNRKDYLLELVEQRPDGPVPEILTSTPVEYQEETRTEYETVSVVPDGPTAIPVERVSR
jgi:hypothetical protein